MAQAQEAVQQLLADFKNGRNPEQAFRAIFATYYPQVCRFFIRRGLAPEDARDLAQDVLFSVYQGLGTIQDEAHFSSWLFTIARNALLNDIEKRNAKKRFALHMTALNDSGEQDMNLLPSQASGDTLASLLDREKMKKLAEALQDLPAQMRRCVQLRVTAECSYQEIASAMGISVNTVKAHLHKGRKSLQEKLRHYFGPSEILKGEDT